MTKKLSRRQRKAKKKEGVYQPSLFDKRRGGQPGNTNAVKHGLYSRRFDPEEIEALSGMQEGVRDEIDAARVSLSRILDYINGLELDKLEIEDYVALQNVIAKYTSTIGRLIQTDKALSDAQNTGIHAQLLAALEDVTAQLEDR